MKNKPFFANTQGENSQIFLCQFVILCNFTFLKIFIGLVPEPTRSNSFNPRIFAPDLDIVEGRDPACTFRQEDGLKPG
jgi:hypothetical protein